MFLSFVVLKGNSAPFVAVLDSAVVVNKVDFIDVVAVVIVVRGVLYATHYCHSCNVSFGAV